VVGQDSIREERKDERKDYQARRLDGGLLVYPNMGSIRL
jgi:hypothetical protein